MCTLEESKSGSNKSPPPLGWRKDIIDGIGGAAAAADDVNQFNNQRRTVIKKINGDDDEDDGVGGKRLKTSSSSSSSTSTSSTTTGSSDNAGSKEEYDDRVSTKIQQKKAKKLAKKEAKKVKKVKKDKRRQEKQEKHERKQIKRNEKEKRKLERVQRKLEKREKKIKDKNGAEAECGPSINLMDNKARAPETKEEWEAKQSNIRKVQDPETGRTRIIKGDGEILEEIVSKERHKDINKKATAEDGAYFQSQTIGWKPPPPV